MSLSRILPLVAVLGTIGCGITDKPAVNTAELLNETQEMVAGLRDELAGLQNQIDSVHIAMARQDSLIRALANLQGMPMPAKPLDIIPPQ